MAKLQQDSTSKYAKSYTFEPNFRLAIIHLHLHQDAHSGLDARM
jgi:hypothetical protein